MDPFTATIIVIVIVVIAAGVLAMNVLRAIRSVRRAAGSEAARLVGKMAEELLSGETGTLPSDLMTSQQPRSISDMTSVYAPRLAKDFPDLNLKQLISSAENKLCAALFAIMQGSAEEAGVQSGIGNYPSVEDAYSADSDERAQLFLGATPDFAAQIQRRIDSLETEGQTECFERIKIHKSGIYSYQKTAGTCVITLQTAIEYLHYIKQNGIVVSGSPQMIEQARYNLTILYIQDISSLPSSLTTAVGVTCPNCGAPVKGLGNRQCEFCGSALQAIDIRIWRINQFAES